MTTVKKPYSSPKLKNLRLNKAKLLLQDQAAHHDPAAKELLDLLRSNPKSNLRTNPKA
jgi:hypothetical protein